MSAISEKGHNSRKLGYRMNFAAVADGDITDLLCYLPIDGFREGFLSGGCGYRNQMSVDGGIR